MPSEMFISQGKFPSPDSGLMSVVKNNAEYILETTLSFLLFNFKTKGQENKGI
jgi:hypothetical protein